MNKIKAYFNDPARKEWFGICLAAPALPLLGAFFCLVGAGIVGAGWGPVIVNDSAVTVMECLRASGKCAGAAGLLYAIAAAAAL